MLIRHGTDQLLMSVVVDVGCVTTVVVVVTDVVAAGVVVTTLGLVPVLTVVVVVVSAVSLSLDVTACFGDVCWLFDCPDDCSVGSWSDAGLAGLLNCGDCWLLGEVDVTCVIE